MKKVLLFLFCLFLPTAASAVCKAPMVDRDFLEIPELEAIDWKVHNIHYYDNSDLGFSIKFLLQGAVADMFIYDLGLSQISDEMVDNELRNAVSDMLEVYKKHKPDTVRSELMHLSKSNFNTHGKLIRDAVFMVAKGPKFNYVTIVSLGFDGKCYQKLRFTMNIGPGADFEDYFENPYQHEGVILALEVFKVFTALLHDELVRTGYYQY